MNNIKKSLIISVLSLGLFIAVGGTASAVSIPMQCTYAQDVQSCIEFYDPNYQHEEENIAPEIILNTVGATDIKTTSAILNGYYSSGRNQGYAVSDQPQVWFEYGTSRSNLSNSTRPYPMSIGSRNFSLTATGLRSGETYYFRIVAQAKDGVVYGNTQSFKTTQGTYTSNNNPAYYSSTTTYIDTGVVNTNPSTGSGGSKSHSGYSKSGSTTGAVMLTIDNGTEFLREGDIVDYVINYKNVSSKMIATSLLKVQLPENVIYISDTARGNHSNSDNSVLFRLRELSAGENGRVSVRGQVGRIGKSNEALAEATLTYTDAATYSQNFVRAFDLDSLIGGNGGGRVGGGMGGDFLPTTVFGWLLILLIIAAIVIIARKFLGSHHGHRKLKEKYTSVPPTYTS